MKCYKLVTNDTNITTSGNGFSDCPQQLIKIEFVADGFFENTRTSPILVCFD